MPYYPKPPRDDTHYPKPPEATAWWDPDEVRARDADVGAVRPANPFFVIDEVSPFYSPPPRPEYGPWPVAKVPWPVGALFAAFAAMAQGAARGEAERRRWRVPRDRPNKPTGSCNACESGKCPMSPRYDLHGRYAGGRFFELVDATPYKKVWRCSRCGETFRGISSDNPANLHSC